MGEVWQRVRRLLLADDPETGWLVRLTLTGLLAWTLSYSGGMSGAAGWQWAALAASLASWLVFALGDGRAPRTALGALALCSALGSVAAGTGGTAGSTAATFTLVGLLTYALHLGPTPRSIVAVAAVDLCLYLLGCWWWGQDPAAALINVAVVVIVVLFGLHRREHRRRARQTARLLEQTRLAQREQARAAALDERARIARELHDVLAHSLGALGVQLEVAEALLTDRGDVEGAAVRVRRARRLAAEGLVEARAAVAALRADVPPLTTALSDLVTAYRQDHQVPVDFRTEGTPRPLAPAAEVSLLGTAREALTNAAKHAPGGPVTVALHFRPEEVRLQVCNGPGRATPAEAVRVNGYGLTGSRERIALVGGTLTAGDPGHPGGGWQVDVRVPA
ncbi:sensor histidine kinase [Micromonospora sp. NPDC050397]|uniref:sensor histidine kinase n=1 Tax=Micromonospora sp. NPDC050397 TaxID=3364279 RepID=UPI00384B67FF